MKSKVVVDVNASPKEVARLFADPSINTQWMNDIERYEPVSGKPGMPGSVYRLIPKRGSMGFTATVVRRLPNRLLLNLEAENLSVEVDGTINALADGRTRLISKEDFKFKGVWNKAYGVLARPALRLAHRRHMRAFKKFVEEQQIAPEPPVTRHPPKKKSAKKTNR